MNLRKSSGSLTRVVAKGAVPPPSCLPHDPDQTNWCWAACVAMALLKRGIKEDQCSIATSHLQLKCCEGASCNFGCKLEDPLGEDFESLFHQYGFGQARLRHGALSRPELIEMLKHGPVAVGWEGSSANPNHIILVTAFKEDLNLASICDPVPSRLSGTMSFAELKRSVINGKLREWKWTWAPLR
jgi:Papain-like cysteine protease AvrRpt2